MRFEPWIEAFEQSLSAELSQAGLLDWASRLTINKAWLASHTAFSSTHYVRKVLHRSEKCEVILVCWEPGQKTAIHDHGASLGVSFILAGALREQTFSAKGDTAIAVDLTQSSAGELLIEKKGVIHQVQAHERSISLHIYVGPLDAMKLYERATAFVSP